MSKSKRTSSKRVEKWSGIVESGVRRHLGPKGQQWFRVQMGGRGKGNRRSQVCKSIDEAIALKREWQRAGVPRPASELSALPDEPTETVGDALRAWATMQPARFDPARTERAKRSIVNGRDGRTCAAVVGRVFPELLAMAWRGVTPDHFVIFRERYVGQGGALAGAATYMGVLRAAIRKQRPAFTLPKRTIPPPDLTRHPMLEPAELKRAFLAVPEPLRTMANVAVVSFMRLSEIRLLTRDALDFTAGTITLHRAKAGPRVVAMSKPLAALLRAQLTKHAHRYVFPRDPRRAGKSVGKPYTQNYLSELWHKCMVRVGLGHFRFHDLRHHAAMVALNKGKAGYPELQALLGHASPRMVMRYATATNENLRDLQERVAAYHTSPTRARAR